MGKPFKGELEKLAGTIKWAEQQDVTRLVRFLFAENKQMPLVCIGSGGSLSACHYAVLLNLQRNGYKEGLTIAKGKPSQGIGGGMCQLSNLIHWLVLHSELTITEHHHHDGLDLFPDFGRQIPFGTGTSISYNYIDYRFCNDTRNTYQLRLWTDDEYLCGELRAAEQQPHTFHIHAENEFFSRENGVVYRHGEVYRDVIDRTSGRCLDSQLIRTNHARVMYDCPPSMVIREESKK